MGRASRFDLPGVATYHTRPMSQDWSRRRDIDLLADEHVRIDFDIPLADFPHLRSHLADTRGNASGRVGFERVQGACVAEITVSAHVRLTCQRCLTPLDHPIECAGRVVMVADGAEADRAPAGLETILAPERRTSVRDLVEEELLLALPIVPRHSATECAPARSTDAESAGAAKSPARSSGTAGASEAPQEKHRPFERLNELFNDARPARIGPRDGAGEPQDGPGNRAQ